MAATLVAAPAAGPGAAVIRSAPAYYAVTKTVTLTNTGNQTAYHVDAQVTLLPPATRYASLQLTGESVVPASVSRDTYGNTIGHFAWAQLDPGQSVTLTFTYTAEVWAIHYRLDAVQGPYETTGASYRTYTDPRLEADAVDTGAPALVALDRSLAPADAGPLDRAQAYFDWIVGHIRYNYSLVPAGSALAVLKTRLGICTDFAELFTGMLRTAHIPARLVDGYVVNNGAGEGGFHQWVEFELPRLGWVAADPTWGVDGYFAALPDDWHIPLYVGGRPDVNVTWQYVPGTAPYIHIQYHYTFKTLAAAPAPARRAALPVLAPAKSTAVRQHGRALPATPWWAVGRAWLAALWHWITGTLVTIFGRLA
ncbi:MAG: transglutaminase domain-containing protein [Actinomycetia bacterium]|nr:transglutaminase domain-containing protein [Actinomycetes bacterium]